MPNCLPMTNARKSSILKDELRVVKWKCISTLDTIRNNPHGYGLVYTSLVGKSIMGPLARKWHTYIDGQTAEQVLCIMFLIGKRLVGGSSKLFPVINPRQEDQKKVSRKEIMGVAAAPTKIH